MKAILVIDIPLSIDCEDLERYEAELKIIDKYEDEYALSKHRLSLKPMPQKKKLDEDLFLSKNFELEYARFDGYNKCIDEILGEQE